MLYDVLENIKGRKAFKSSHEAKNILTAKADKSVLERKLKRYISFMSIYTKKS